ncbi:MAG: type II toxin-antitoxin system VapC family toxin [Magnetococcus sp. YQC-3]
MKCIVDARVALKWFLPDEPGADVAARLVEAGGLELLAPEWIVPEVCNAVWKMVRSNRISRAQGELIIAGLPMFFTQLVTTVAEAPRAMDIVLTIDHPIYDFFYIALAERENALLVTADDRLLARLPGTPWEARAISLSQWVLRD